MTPPEVSPVRACLEQGNHNAGVQALLNKLGEKRKVNEKYEREQ